MSETDIDKGTRGLDEIGRVMSEIKVGISCLTVENLQQPWIFFEAGALSKTIDDKTRLCTYLIGDMEPRDIRPPLGMFQATRATQEDTLKLMHTINRAVSDDPIPEQALDEVFSAMWPKLEMRLSTLPPAPPGINVKRSTDDMVSEILEIVRGEAFRRSQDPLLTYARSLGFYGNVLTPGEEIMPIPSSMASAAEARKASDDDEDVTPGRIE